MHFSLEYSMTVIFNSLSGNSYTSISLGQFLEFYLVFYLENVFLFLHLTLCVGICSLEKTVTFPGFYRQTSNKRPCQISLARDCGGLSSLLCVCVFSGFVLVNSQL